MSLPDSLAAESYCYLTTTGRVSGRPHEIEIWFGSSDGDSIYMLAGGRDRADWVRNLQQQPSVRVRIGDRRFGGRARLVTDAGEEALARRLLLAKYQPDYSDDLSDWGRDALPVAVDLELSGP
jgi:deazaflavin-dependent oxidoreductase (nitroreductase family)